MLGLKKGWPPTPKCYGQKPEYGKDAAVYYLLGEARSYLEEDASRYRRPIVTHVYRDAIELYDRHLYEKGACIYHMMRGILGNEFVARSRPNLCPG